MENESILPLNDAVLTSPFGQRMLNGVKQFHGGLDMVTLVDYKIKRGLEKDLSKQDRSVYAVSNGVISFDYDIYDDRFRWLRRQDSVGNMVIQKVLISGIFYSFRYCHLIENFVNHGQAVKQGDLIGIYGDVGYSFGAHLHIDVSPGDYFDRLKIINPCSLFTEAEFKQIA